ncbi:MAG: sigma-70 family RNA polymerase sigma factor [bacterium]|nr:sigma-70 family RNA polymerase sigma factor [bacterium]
MNTGNKKYLIDRLKKQEKEAQTELVKKFSSRLLLYFRLRIKGEETYEDLVQEVFASFFVGVNKDKIPEDALIAPFIFGIAKRVMFNFFYKKKRNDNIQKKGENNFELSYDFQEEERLTNESMNNTIQQVMKKLPDIDKTILKEFYLKENSVGEVAEIIGKTKHYVSVRKERALKKIKNEISKQKDVYK